MLKHEFESQIGYTERSIFIPKVFCKLYTEIPHNKSEKITGLFYYLWNNKVAFRVNSN